MPSTRPCAAFEPIPPNFDVHALVNSTPNFEWVQRFHCDMIEHLGLRELEKLVLKHVILGGKPLVFEGYDAKLDRGIFDLQWLRENCGSQVVEARDLTKQRDVQMSIGHYLRHMYLLTNQWNISNFKDPNRQRIYLKDIDCPSVWHEKIKELIPDPLFYLNESTINLDRSGSVKNLDQYQSGFYEEIPIAKAGDLMSSLPTEMRAENLQCYIGHEGTYTPAHREMCASLGQNIMVEASTGEPEDDKPTKPGSSIWFMTETKERQVVSEYWLSHLGHDIEVEKHFAQINAWKNAPFKTYVVEQKPGDFILIPPLAPHQVWNRGTRTMKIAWNRTTVETLEMAIDEALPKARIVCRDEQYKNKAIIYFSLDKYSKLLKQVGTVQDFGSTTARTSNAKVQQLFKDFRRLHTMFTKILLSESFSAAREEQNIEMEPFDSNITCSYCRCNIFNRFLTCPSCVGKLPNGDKDTYDICLECYAMGRSCACISNLRWVEQFDWAELVQKHDQWRKQIIKWEGKNDAKSPKSLKEKLRRLNGKRTLAQICQIELAKRPWHDIRKLEVMAKGIRDEVVDIDNHGKTRKNKKSRRSEKFLRDHARCHIDCHWEPKWKQAACTACEKSYCYGNLFRAYDEMPQDIVANPDWRCPSCRKICGCRHCRTKPGYKMYIPKGTLLGHNTKLVADDRSVESLIDFSYSNLAWIQKAGDDRGPEDSQRMQLRRKEADKAMSTNPELGDHYVDDEGHNGFVQRAEPDSFPIDPALSEEATLTNGDSAEDSDVIDENPEEAHYGIAMHSTPLVPKGGVVRDAQHAYDVTDAITFVYPSPDMVDRLPPEVQEEHQTAGLDFATVGLESPNRTERFDRKRKRTKLDSAEKISHPRPATKKQRKRRSLVVKLDIDRIALAQISNMVSPDQGAFPTDIHPTINSDLQALNLKNTGIQEQSRVKKTRTDPEETEMDPEYTPSRYRNRHKSGANGSPLSSPGANGTPRITRTTRITWDGVNDQDEFSMTSRSKTSNSKLVTTQQQPIPASIARASARDWASDSSDEELPSAMSGKTMSDMGGLTRVNSDPETPTKSAENHIATRLTRRKVKKC